MTARKDTKTEFRVVAVTRYIVTRYDCTVEGDENYGVVGSAHVREADAYDAAVHEANQECIARGIPTVDGIVQYPRRIELDIYRLKR